MDFKDIFVRVQRRMQRAKRSVERERDRATVVMRSLLESFSDDWMEQAFTRARQIVSPPIEELPVDFRLRQSLWLRRTYEKVFKVSHVFKIGLRYGREYLEDYMPISPDAFIGRGSYKFVYKLPWQMVLKVSRHILPSDPICGSLFREVDKHQEQFLTKDELLLQDYMNRNAGRGRREHNRFLFNRLGMERYHYWKVREAIPDLVIPTRYFMGVRYRTNPFFQSHTEKITPMDSQIMLAGKHLKEFAVAGKRSEQNILFRKLRPSYDFTFDGRKFGSVQKGTLLKITNDFKRLIRFTEQLAVDEKLILDIHTENIIITLPEFELKIFDFHLFDEHLYEAKLEFNRPEKEHIEIIEQFVESLALES